MSTPEPPALHENATDRRRPSTAYPHESNVYQASEQSLDRRIRSDLYLAGAVLLLAALAIQWLGDALRNIHLFWVLLLLSGFFSWRRYQDQVVFRSTLLESAQVDPLTRINNHLGLEGALAREASRLKRHKIPFSILMIDIDDFALINGLYGYKTGDLILQHIARMLGGAVRITDTIGRYSGEEFLVILANTRTNDAVLVGERIRNTLLEKPIRISTETIHTSISIGVAEYSLESDSIDKLISHADDALKQAKTRGKNQVCSWHIH